MLKLTADPKLSMSTAASNSTWPEYEILNEDEPELDTKMSEDSGHANALVPESHADETGNSLLDKFEVWIAIVKMISDAIL